jgi:putative two-component system response regulator
MLGVSDGGTAVNLREEAEPISVLLVDDDPLGLELIRQLISDLVEAEVVGFSDPRDALAWCQSHQPDLIITDYRMPGLSGTELIRALRAESGTAAVPIMMITAMEDRAIRYEALEQGATDVLGKPIDPVEVRARTRNMLAIRQGQRLMAQRSATLEQEVRRATVALAAREQETILRLSKAAEYRDWETGLHIVRVAWYTRLIALNLNLPEAEQEIIFRSSPMHDVGKIGVPDYILLKPGALDDAEFALMKQHTVIGHRILGGSPSELLQAAAEIALSHHERYDGTGYPQGKRGENIPLRGRIVAVADTFDALTSQRPYKQEWPSSLAWAFLEQHAGSRFDPLCVEAFMRGRSAAEETRAAFPDAGPSGTASTAAAAR